MYKHFDDSRTNMMQYKPLPSTDLQIRSPLADCISSMPKQAIHTFGPDYQDTFL